MTARGLARAHLRLAIHAYITFITPLLPHHGLNPTAATFLLSTFTFLP